MKQQVSGDRIVVKLVDQEERSESGIILFRPDSTDPELGEVVAVGQGTKTKKGGFNPSVHAVGDHVMFTNGAGVRVKLDGENLIILKEDDIFGVVEND